MSGGMSNTAHGRSPSALSFGQSPIYFFSSECQVQHYRHGQPPHKQISSKPLRSVPLDLATSHAEEDAFPLYTESPTPALALQVSFLKRGGTQWDYHFVAADGRPISRSFGGKAQNIFLEARSKAMEKRDLASIAIMARMLGFGAMEGEFTSQLEKEYEVNMRECIKVALETSAVYQDMLLREHQENPSPVTSIFIV